MDALLKTLQLGFILRSLFAGVFFIVGYQFADGGPSALALNFSGDAGLTSKLATAAFAGITLYVLHRAAIYPIIEYVFSLEAIDRCRRRWPLISVRSLDVLGDLWCAGAESGKHAEAIARQIAVWGDYTHMLYVSALCLATGSVLRTFATPSRYEFSTTLAGVAFLLFLAGLVSNWRLHSVREQLLPKRVKPSA